MVNETIFRKDVQKFIRKNLKIDLSLLILKGSPFPEVSIQELATQVQGLKISEKKFPLFFYTENILFPPKLNLEQASSELTALYKASLIEGNMGIDLTGGLGIDSYFISKKFESFIYCELNADLAKIASHNFNSLNAVNIRVEKEDALQVLFQSKDKFDWVYADPARRNATGGKVFKLEDCEPNLVNNLAAIFKKTDKLLVKTSPLLDLQAGLKELKHVKEIHVVAIKNEVKELLWILEKGWQREPKIITINMEKNGEQKFKGTTGQNLITPELAPPQNYLYEPNSAILKSGLFNLISQKTGTKKLHQHSHLFTSENLKIFPGRSFQIIDIKEYKPSELKLLLKNKKANITTRNFPDSVENIRKKFRIKDGGKDYIFFTTDLHNKLIVIFCEKV
ncbi:class I SAM-dependent methyltransferase [Gramella sp. AN32]|uniref:Class I SAM-dependent methyltransferase n=1 Tax=Christiangramia antarctica TaxID=2058158 RepID=A0ABW5WZZ9_9FLAO|nr:class I SAM-dependent methyltransferase [Gramella sp. AN32]MCM4156770.1 SAM-dependent methyltransferase [Gramella sp. AN32]